MLSVMSVVDFHCEANGIQNFFPNLMYILKRHFDQRISKFKQVLDNGKTRCFSVLENLENTVHHVPGFTDIEI